MLNSIFILVEHADPADLKDLTLPSNTCLVFKASGNDEARLNTVYRLLLQTDYKGPFCLLVTPAETNDPADQDRFINNVIPFIFDHKYLIRDFNIPFLFSQTSREGTPFITSFQKKMAAQGYDQLQIVQLDKGYTSFLPGAVQYIGPPDTTSPAQSIEAYNAYLKGIPPFPDSFLFETPSISYALQLIKGLETTEEALLKDARYIHSLLSGKEQARSTLQTLQVETGLLKEDLDSLKSYFSFYNEPNSGYRKKVKEISDFYHYEYDILPLWFKQLGHLIKVLMGKRTFRSLFDDNVKKYDT